MLMAFSVPSNTEHYPEFIDHCLLDIRSEAGNLPLTFTHREIHNGRVPALLLDFYSPTGQLYPCRLNLPPDTPTRNEFRIDILLHTLQGSLQ